MVKQAILFYKSRSNIYTFLEPTSTE